MKHVLVAYDGSPPSRRALVHAADLAEPGDRMTVVNVMPEPGVGARIEPPIEARREQHRLLDEAQRRLAGLGVEASAVAPAGNTATEILAAAKAVDADVIVVARRGGRLHHLVGSISGRIVASAACDVLVVHEAGAGAS